MRKFRDVLLAHVSTWKIDSITTTCLCPQYENVRLLLLVQDELVDEVLLLRLPPEERGVVLLQPLVLELLLLHQGRELLRLGGALLGISKR